jgi:hypothetical protein
LAAVQKRREWPAKMTQKFQVLVHRRFFSGQGNVLAVSPLLRYSLRCMAPLLRRLMPRLIGIGFRSEHIKSSALQTQRSSL